MICDAAWIHRVCTFIIIIISFIIILIIFTSIIIYSFVYLFVY